MAAALVVGLLPGANEARAEVREQPRGEWGLSLAQAGASVAVAAGMTGAVWALGEASDGDASALGIVALLAATPLVTAGTVCGLGTMSERFVARGECWPVLASTYASALITVGFMGALLWDTNAPGENWSNRTAFLVIGGIWTAANPLLANTSWHLFKRPRLAGETLALATRQAAGVTRHWRETAIAGQLTLPLVAASF